VGIPPRNVKPSRIRLRSLSKPDIYNTSPTTPRAQDGLPGGMSPRSGESTPLRGPGTITNQSVGKEEVIARAETITLRKMKEETKRRSSTPSLGDSPAVETPTVPGRNTSQSCTR